MFNLEREVAAWSAAVNAKRCQPAANVAELSDHLYCEIDRSRAEGLTDEEAFRTAIARLGSAPELTAEHAKNQSALGTVCQVAAKLDGPRVSSGHRGLLVTHALVWAALMIGTALVLKKTAASETSGWLVAGIFTFWLASDRILRRTLRQRPPRGV